MEFKSGAGTAATATVKTRGTAVAKRRNTTSRGGNDLELGGGSGGGSSSPSSANAFPELLQPLMKGDNNEIKDENDDGEGDAADNDNDEYDDDDKHNKDMPLGRMIATAFFYLAVFLVVNLVTFMGMYIYHTPARVRAHHKVLLDKQLAQYAQNLKEQKESWSKSIADLTNKVSEEKVELEQQQEGGGGTKPFKTLSQLESEVKHDEEELKEVQKKLTEEEEREEKDRKEFCSFCSFNYKGLSTTCGARMQYLEDTYGTPIKEARTAVMTWDPSCRRTGS